MLILRTIIITELKIYCIGGSPLAPRLVLSIFTMKHSLQARAFESALLRFLYGLEPSRPKFYLGCIANMLTEILTIPFFTLAVIASNFTLRSPVHFYYTEF